MMRLAALVMLVAACGGATAPPMPTITNTAPRPVPGAAPHLMLAVVYNAQEIWIGNDDVETDPVATYEGFLKPWQAALQEVPLASFGSPKSEAVLVSYAVAARVQRPRGALASVTREAFGTQQDYYTQIGNELVRGVELGMAELAATGAPTKALLVLGDGNDEDNAEARTRLATLRRDASAREVQVFALRYQSKLSDEGEVISHLTDHVYVVTDSAQMAAALRDIRERLRR